MAASASKRTVIGPITDDLETIVMFPGTWIFPAEAMSTGEYLSAAEIAKFEKAERANSVSAYGAYGTWAAFGSPAYELIQIIKRKKKAGLDTSKEEEKFNLLIARKIEYEQELKTLRKTKEKTK